MHTRPTGPISDPPSAHEVALRCFVLGRIVRYARSLRTANSRASEKLEDIRAQAVGALEPFVASISEDERFLLICPPLELANEQISAAHSQLDALQPLVWSIGHWPDLPPYDVEADLNLLDVSDSIASNDFLLNVRLRPAAAIERARATAELWHWRSRTRQLLETGDAPPIPPGMSQLGVSSYADLIRWTAEKTLRNGNIDAVLDGDFVAFGKPYRDLTNREWARVRCITVERHYALNWLCGYAPDNQWDDTPTDT
ncbi:MAG: hypothetical protein JNM30_07900 [Rhodospirillales bacterium]|nr:hypothetical protein [Rhodospirillales bacterium]